MDLYDPQCTRRPDASLLYRRNDANDVRLGEVVCTDAADYARAQVVILGCPQDEGVQRNSGRPGAALAPAEIRRYLYRLTINGLEDLCLFDLGDTLIQPSLEETHALHQCIVRQIIEDGKRLVVLGGGNDIAYPDCVGLAQAAGEVLAFNVDAHFDVRADVPRNSGTSYRQLLEEGFIRPARFYQVGYQPFANSPIYERYLRGLGVHLIGLTDLRCQGIEPMLAAILDSEFSIRNCFWGFDLDAVCTAEAPGVSAPNPIGLTGDELCRIAEIAGSDPRTRIVEFTEVNPNYDVDGRTARLAAVAVWRVLAGLARCLHVGS